MKRPATRTADIRKHLMRSLGRALVEHERLTTTLARAKALRPMIEQWITLAKKAQKMTGAERLGQERRLRAEVQLDALVRKLIDDLGKRTESRPGGYTRILKLGHRVGDAAPKALIELVDKPVSATPEKTAKAASKAKATKNATQAGK